MSMRRAMRRLVLATVMACVTLFGVRPASAQGTSDLFPDPLTSAEIESALDRIGISGDARTSALRSFEEYVGRFLDLRKGDIETYLQGRADVGSAERSRETIAARVQDRERLLKRIASLENQLFDAFTGLAGDGGAAQAARERMHAERRRDWMASSPFMGRGSRVELAEVLDTMLERQAKQLSAETRAKVDAILLAHEESLTGQCRKLLDISANEPVALYDAHTAANLKRPQAEPGKQPAPEEWSAYFRGAEAVRAKAREPQTDLRRAMRKATRDAALRVADALPADIGQSFRDSFFSRAYASIASPRDPVPPLVKRAKSLAEKGDIDEATIRNIESIAASHVGRRNELTNRIAEKIEQESGGEGGFFISFGGDDSDGERKSESSKLLEERSKLDAATVAAITGTSEALAKKDDGGERHELTVNGSEVNIPEGISVGGASIMIVAGTSDGGDMGEPIVFSSDGDDGGMTFTIDALNGPQVGVVQPMGKEWLDRIRKSYGLTDEQMNVVQLLYDDYRSKQAEIEAGELAELKSLPSGMGGVVFAVAGDSPAPEPPKATAETVRRRFELKRSITQRVIALDGEFFDGLGAAIGDRVPAAEVTRLKHERERSAYLAADRGGGMMIGGFGGSKAPTVDLAEVVRDASLDGSSFDAIRGRLDVWDVAATDAFRQRFGERMAVQEGQEEFERKMAEEAAADGRPGEIRISSNDASGAKMEALEKRAKAADELTRAVNEGARDDMIAAIPADEAKRLLRDAWNRKAWPQVFRDRRSVQPKVDEALAFADLTDAQRTSIRAIVAEHLAEYRRIGDEMIEAHEKSAPKPSADGGERQGIDVSALRKRQETMNRLTFERDELNEKTFRRVKECLSEEQSRKLGEMPERKKRGGPGGIQLPEGVDANIRIGG